MFPIIATCIDHLILLDFIKRMIFGEEMRARDLYSSLDYNKYASMLMCSARHIPPAACKAHNAGYVASMFSCFATADNLCRPGNHMGLWNYAWMEIHISVAWTQGDAARFSKTQHMNVPNYNTAHVRCDRKGIARGILGDKSSGKVCLA